MAGPSGVGPPDNAIIDGQSYIPARIDKRLISPPISRHYYPQNRNITSTQIPVRITHRGNLRSSESKRHNLENCIPINSKPNLNNLIPIKTSESNTSKNQIPTSTSLFNPGSTLEFAPSLLLSNVMSLVPKIDELQVFVMEESPDFIFITETWLKEDICNNKIQLPCYNVTRRDRRNGLHGGVCLFSRESIKIEVINQYDDTNQEVLWVLTRPSRHPRGIPCIITGTVYHPPSANNNSMIEHLSNSLTEIEGQFPGCGIIIAGDFNQLDIKVFAHQFQLKQLVHFSTRGNNKLDLVLINLARCYESSSVYSRPPFGLSDHSSVFIQPKERETMTSSCKIVYRRDTCPSRKHELGRFFYNIDWSLLQTIASCNEKSKLFEAFINLGLDSIMPTKKVKLHHNDAPG